MYSNHFRASTLPISICDMWIKRIEIHFLNIDCVLYCTCVPAFVFLRFVRRMGKAKKLKLSKPKIKIPLSEQIEIDSVVQSKNRSKMRHRQDEDESVSDMWICVARLGMLLISPAYKFVCVVVRWFTAYCTYTETSSRTAERAWRRNGNNRKYSIC